MRTNKDVTFFSMIIIWLIGGGLTLILTNINPHLITIFFICVMSVLILFKKLNRNFGLWLEKPFKNKK